MVEKYQKVIALIPFLVIHSSLLRDNDVCLIFELRETKISPIE
jgi:hypothetical protein